MRVQQVIDKIRFSPYYKRWIELKQMGLDEYRNRWEMPVKLDWYYRRAISSLEKHSPSFTKKIDVWMGMYEFQCCVYIGLPPFYYDNKIEAIINISSGDSINPYIEGWRRIDLQPSDNLNEIEDIVKKHLSKFFWDEGVLCTEQWARMKTKDDSLWWVKEMIRQKAYINRPSMNDDRTRRWIAKHFNIDSHVSIESTVKIVNQIGKQVETKKIYAMEFPDMDYFDGDIDDLENEIYELNRYDRNTILI